MLAGMAVRMAHALQLHRELEHDPLGKDMDKKGKLTCIDREVRRRAMWACFMMDRFTASGTERPMYAHEDDIKILLPVDEMRFNSELPGLTETLEDEPAKETDTPDGQGPVAPTQVSTAAYMVRVISLWGRVIKYENMGGKEKDPNPMWTPESQFRLLKKKASDLQQGLPASMSYSKENLQNQAAAKTANQFVFIHVTLHQNLLFLHRFAVPAAPNVRPSKDLPQSFRQEAFQIALDSAVQISKLLADALDYRVVAPFMGYCAFTSSTVLAWAVFFGRKASQPLFYQYLAQNIHYLRSLKRHWGVLHFMAKSLRDIYGRYKQIAKTGANASMKEVDSIDQYGDWFGKFPRGVARPGEEHAESKPDIEPDTADKTHETEDKRNVEDFFDSLAESKKPPPVKKQKKTTRASAPSSRRPSQQAARKTSTSSRPELPIQSPDACADESAGSRQPLTQDPFSPPQQAYPVTQASYSVPLESAALGPPNTSLIPQLDRQIVYGAYAGQDPTASTPASTLNAMNTVTSPQGYSDAENAGDIWASEAQSMEFGGLQQMMMGPGDEYLEEYNSAAWFMPFNLQPPGHEAYIVEG